MHTNKKKLSIILVSVLAFGVVAYLSFPHLGNLKNGINGEGQRRFRVESFQDQSGWAYRIYEDTTAVIEQKTIPGRQGNNGFASKEQALKTGTLVISKLDRGIFPPTVSKHELDSLGVKY